jgi:hypothetical protein
VRRPRVVDDDVEAAEGYERELDQALDIRVFRHVAGKKARGAAGRDDVRDGVLAVFGVHVVGNHARALGREALRDAAAEARACAGNDGNLVR